MSYKNTYNQRQEYILSFMLADNEYALSNITQALEKQNLNASSATLRRDLSNLV
jgi:hypothetical protein